MDDSDADKPSQISQLCGFFAELEDTDKPELALKVCDEKGFQGKSRTMKVFSPDELKLRKIRSQYVMEKDSKEVTAN